MAVTAKVFSSSIKTLNRAARKIWIRLLGYPEKYRTEIDGFRMVLNLRDQGISQALFYDGAREKDFMSLIKRTVKKGMTCLDLGANIGYTTLTMVRLVAPSGLVYSIEPDPHNLDMLKANIEANNFGDYCEIIDGVVSNKSGHIDFWLADRPNVSSVDRTEHSRRKITVRSYSFPELMSRRKLPDFIKMDVEGHEVKIFESALPFFSSNTRTVNLLVEVHPAYYSAENDFASILREYFKIGFAPKFVVATPMPRPRLFAEAGYEPVETFETDGVIRGLYNDISKEDLVRFACYEHIGRNYRKIVRAFMLSRK